MIDAAQQKELDDLKAQQAAIAAKIKSQEAAMLGGVINQVRGLIKQYGLTQAQVFGGAAPRGAGKASSKVFKYRDDKGNKWSGGRGRVPDWVKAVKAAGGDIEKYRV
jgi:DNA-binding protein H-NS